MFSTAKIQNLKEAIRKIYTSEEAQYVKERLLQYEGKLKSKLQSIKSKKLKRADKSKATKEMKDDFLTDSTVLCSKSGDNKVNIIGDGNCFFRCVSYGVFGKQDYHVDIRESIVEELSKNPHIYSEFVDGDFNRSSCNTFQYRYICQK